MAFLPSFFLGYAFIILVMTGLWLVSVWRRDASIVDPFWGAGFVLITYFYAFLTGEMTPRGWLLLALVTIWGGRLSLYLFWRNRGKGEDFRYQAFRQKFGPERYWWFSFFQVFLLQGTLLWLISAPLLASLQSARQPALRWLDYAALLVWLVGFIFEAGADWQLARFKANPANRGRLLTSGFWCTTRHPNYFGDATIWWGYALLSLGAGYPLPMLGAGVMTILLLRVSGVKLLERTLQETKPGYKDYVQRTSAFFPWFPRRPQRPDEAR